MGSPVHTDKHRRPRMNKSEEQQAARAKHIQEIVNKSTNTAKAVRKLEKELFISSDTIYRDLKKDLKK